MTPIKPEFVTYQDGAAVDLVSVATARRLLEEAACPATMRVRVRRTSPEAILPTYATAGAACFDLHADPTGWSLAQRAHGILVDYDDRRPVVFGTGLAVEVPAGWAMLIYSRSGHGFKNSVRLSNCVGVIDSDYRGEIRVSLAADQRGALRVMPGDRIAQAMLVPVYRVAFDDVAELSETARGAGGLGSTGR